MTLIKSGLFTLSVLLLGMKNIHAMAMEPVLVTTETKKEFDLNYRVDIPQYDPELAVIRLTLERKGGFAEVASAFFEKRSGERATNIEISVPVVIKMEKTTAEILVSIDPRSDASGWYLLIPQTCQPKTLSIIQYLIPLKPHVPPYVPSPPEETPKGP